MSKLEAITQSGALMAAIWAPGYLVFVWFPNLAHLAVVIAAWLFAILATGAAWTVIYHFLREVDGHIEAGIEADKQRWREALEQSQSHKPPTPMR